MKKRRERELSEIGNICCFVRAIVSVSLTKVKRERDVIKGSNDFGGTHCTENPISVFTEMKLRGLIPNSLYIHVSLSDSCVPRIDLPILHRYMNVKLGYKTL